MTTAKPPTPSGNVSAARTFGRLCSMSTRVALWAKLTAVVSIAAIGVAFVAPSTGCGSDDAPINTSTDAGREGGSSACRQTDVQCGGACTNARTDPKNCGACGTVCAGAEVCDLGRCAAGCSTGLTQCGQSCIEVSSDPDNCGGCGKACGDGEQCSGGQCSCGPGKTACNGSCVDLSKDPANCGACGTSCTSTMAVCSQGACAAGCAPGLTN